MRAIRLAGIACVSTVSLFLAQAGCDEKSNNAVKDAANSAADSAKDATAAVSEKAAEAFAAARDKAVESFGPQMEEAKTMLASFRSKLSSVAADQKPALESLLSGLDTQFKSVTDMLAQLKTSGASNWQDLSTKLGDALKKLMTGLNEAKTKFGM